MKFKKYYSYCSCNDIPDFYDDEYNYWQEELEREREESAYEIDWDSYDYDID